MANENALTDAEAAAIAGRVEAFSQHRWTVKFVAHNFYPDGSSRYDIYDGERMVAMLHDKSLADYITALESQADALLREREALRAALLAAREVTESGECWNANASAANERPLPPTASAGAVDGAE